MSDPGARLGMVKRSIQERLKWFWESHYQESNKQVVIKETKKGGEAEVDCMVTGYAISFSFLPQLNILKNRSCADGIIFELVDKDGWKLHIVECKTTVRKKDWEEKIKKQFEGALLHAYALMGILGISRIVQIKCYTAYRNDDLTPEKSSDSVFYKPLVGKPIQDKSILEWLNGKITLLSLKDIEHHQIQLDEQGKGTIRLG